jgi:hypothetical protein
MPCFAIRFAKRHSIAIVLLGLSGIDWLPVRLRSTAEIAEAASFLSQQIIVVDNLLSAELAVFHYSS